MPGVTTVRAIHITELRSRIDAARGPRGLPQFMYTDPPPSPGSVIVDRHVSEMRSALAEGWAEAGLALPVYTIPVLTGVSIRAVHISELRRASTGLEAAP